MNVLKTPSFFRPTSRPSSPSLASAPPSRPDSAQALASERTSRPLNKLALSNFRRPSPAPFVAPSPTPTPLIQDVSYLEMLGLKLSEAVSKALAQPSGPALPHELVAGKRPLPPGRGHALGLHIASELKANQNKPSVYRAIVRSLHRPLSVLLTNLSAHLLPLLSSPSFNSPPAPTVQNPNPNPTQLHALAIANFAGELLDTFDELGLGLDSDARGDALKPIREGLVSVTNRVISPLISNIRNELMPLIDALESPNTSSPKTIGSGKLAKHHHPSIITMQSIMPIYAKALAKYTSDPRSHTMLATFLIVVVWKGLVALSHRPFVASPPPSPNMIPAGKKSRIPLNLPTPPVTPPPGRFTLKLPPSRPPSPPMVAIPASAAADTQALYDLLNILPRPDAARAATRLAREAVDEAFEALKALSGLLEAIHNKISHGRSAKEMAKEISILTEDIPLLIALPLLLHAYGGSTSTSVAHLLQVSEDEYRRGCLTGIGRAEECAPMVAHQVMDTLRRGGETDNIVYEWLEIETSADD